MIDWQQIALNIQQKMPLQVASLKLGLCKGYLSELARCEIQEPRFSIGMDILDLHFDLCKEKHKMLKL